MHLKNFSMMTDNPSRIVLTPAYDLLSVRILLSISEDPEELALTINGKKNKLGLRDFLQLAETMKIPEKSAQNAMDRICNKLEPMKEFIENSFLEDRHQMSLIGIIERNIQILTN